MKKKLDAGGGGGVTRPWCSLDPPISKTLGLLDTLPCDTYLTVISGK